MLRRRLSTATAATSSLVRDYLSSTLYARASGYFESLPVGQQQHQQQQPPSPRGASGGEVAGMRGEREWRAAWVRMNEGLSLPTSTSASTGTEGKTGSHRWLTPSETFDPFYAWAVAEWIVGEERGGGRVNVVEVGGGNGTNAVGVLDRIKRMHPALDVRYTLCEITPALAEVQRKRIRDAGHDDVCRVVNADFLTWNEEQPPNTAVVALEVFDNLPHDLFRFAGPLLPDGACSAFSDAPSNWTVAHVTRTETAAVWGSPKLDFRRIDARDDLSLTAARLFLKPDVFARPKDRVFSKLPTSLREARTMWGRAVLRAGRDRTERGAPASQAFRDVFVPTGAVAFFQTLKRCFPSPRLLVADYDELPASDAAVASTLGMPGALFGVMNAPIVAGRNGDYATFLVPQGSADIFFPSDFARLCEAFEAIVGGDAKATHEKSRAFLARCPDAVKATTTQSGFNPMLEDWDNTSVLRVQAPPKL